MESPAVLLKEQMTYVMSGTAARVVVPWKEQAYIVGMKFLEISR
jgi:hypothetical protein